MKYVIAAIILVALLVNITDESFLNLSIMTVLGMASTVLLDLVESINKLK